MRSAQGSSCDGVLRFGQESFVGAGHQCATAQLVATFLARKEILTRESKRDVEGPQVDMKRESKQDKPQLAPRALKCHQSSSCQRIIELNVCPDFKVLSRFMATTRLRRAFRYPEDSGDEGHEREELDEEGPFAMLFSRYVVPDSPQSKNG